MSEKTERPTPKRLREARSKGQVATSRTVGAVAGLVAGVLAITNVGAEAGKDLANFARLTLSGASATESPGTALGRALQVAAHVAVPVMAATIASALVATAIQVGFHFRAEAVAPQFDRINPIAGAKRILSPKGLFELLKAGTAVSLVLWVACAELEGSVRDLAGTPRLDAASALQIVFTRALDVAKRALVVVVAVAAADYAWQRHQFIKGLKMSTEEVKREYRESEGDPLVKSKRKAAARALLNGTASRGVQGANVVVVNPTHVCVAIRYHVEECATPTVTARAVGERAQRLRHQAERLGVPVVRDVALARSLAYLEVGEQIPEELYEAVAVVLKTAIERNPEAARPFDQRARGGRR